MHVRSASFDGGMDVRRHIVPLDRPKQTQPKQNWLWRNITAIGQRCMPETVYNNPATRYLGWAQPIQQPQAAAAAPVAPAPSRAQRLFQHIRSNQAAQKGLRTWNWTCDKATPIAQKGLETWSWIRKKTQPLTDKIPMSNRDLAMAGVAAIWIHMIDTTLVRTNLLGTYTPITGGSGYLASWVNALALGVLATRPNAIENNLDDIENAMVGVALYHASGAGPLLGCFGTRAAGIGATLTALGSFFYLPNLKEKVNTVVKNITPKWFSADSYLGKGCIGAGMLYAWSSMGKGIPSFSTALIAGSCVSKRVRGVAKKGLASLGMLRYFSPGSASTAVDAIAFTAGAICERTLALREKMTQNKKL